MSAPRRPKYLVPAELTLVVLTLATIYGFSRVFSSNEFVVPMVAVGLYTHAIAAITRRRGWSVPLAAAVALPGFLLLVAWLLFFSHTSAGVPTGATWTAVRDAMSQSWETYQVSAAPAPALPGFVLASCAALFFAVFLADWAAFRLWSAFEAIVPTATLFIFCSLLGSQDHRIDSLAVFMAAVLGFLLVHRVARQETSAGWLSADVDRGSQAALRSGALLSISALAIGLLAGQLTPGLNSPAMVSWRGNDSGPGSRVTISPLVDIQDRLTNKSNVEVFTVKSTAPAYWRMTSLDTFVGDIWRSGGKYTSVAGDLDVINKPPVQAVDADQTYTITNLSVLWLPAAYEPRYVDSPRVDVRYQADSSTLIVDTSQTDSNGMSYRVQSDIPNFTQAELRGADTGLSNEMRQRYLDLPSDFSSEARQVAVAETAAGATAYDKARLLQDYFINNYTYDLQVPRGHGESAIDQFLQDKRGYCEQFAGTYAAMARSIGLPARVAVGFTQGEADPTVPNLYHVRGEHAHAWPEVYLGQYGWVPFEPTPGRGAPNGEAWTGRPPAQDASGPEATATTAATATTVVQGPATTVAAAPTTVAPDVVVGNDPATPAVEEEPSTARWVGQQTARLAVLAAVVLVLIGIYAAIVLSIKRSRRAKRRAHATDAGARVRVSWAESVEALALVGTVRRPSETHEEFAQRAAERLGPEASRLIDLAADVDCALYAPDGVSDEAVERAEAASTTLVSLVESRTTPTQQWIDRLDPRPLLPRWRPTSRHRASSTR